MIKIEFTKKFANKKPGDKAIYHKGMASKLINKRKVAKLIGTVNSEEIESEKAAIKELNLKRRIADRKTVAKAQAKLEAELKKEAEEKRAKRK